jgi:hypothetical protein
MFARQGEPMLPPRWAEAEVYLTNEMAEGRISSKVGMRFWYALGNLPVPAMCPGPDGQMIGSWDSGPHHFELEVIGDGTVELFSYRWDTGSARGDEGMDLAMLPGHVLGMLRLAAGIEKECPCV